VTIIEIGTRINIVIGIETKTYPFIRKKIRIDLVTEIKVKEVVSFVNLAFGCNSMVQDPTPSTSQQTFYD